MRRVSRYSRASNDASFIATTSSIAAIRRSVSSVEDHAAQRRLELEGDHRQAAAARDRLVVRDRDRRVEGRALVGRDREHEQALRPGALGPLRLLDRLLGELGREAGDDRDVAGLVDGDAQDALPLVGPQVRALAGVGVDRERDRALGEEPLEVAAIGGLVEPAVRVEGDDAGRDDAPDVEGHGVPPCRRSGRRIGRRAGAAAGRRAEHDLGRQLLVPGVRAVEHAGHRGEPAPAELAQVHPDGRQGRRGERRDPDVVEARDRHVVRDADPELGEPAQRARARAGRWRSRSR